MDTATLIKNYFRAVEKRDTWTSLCNFYHPEVEQTEFPSSLAKKPVKRDLAALKEASEKGKMLLQKESYEIKNIYSTEHTVVAEVIWTGTLAIPFGGLSAGSEIRAYFAQFFELKDGRIFRQRTYDCFENFSLQ